MIKRFHFWLLWLSAYVVLLGFFFTTVLKDSRYLEIFPHELVFPAIMYAVTAILIALAIFWLPWHRSFAGKLASTVILALLVAGYDGNLAAMAGPIRALIPALTPNDGLPIVSLVYLLILFGLAVLIGMGIERLALSRKNFRANDLERVVYVMLGVLFLLPAFSMARILPSMISQARVQAEEFNPPAGQTSKDKPDIYYIVLDRYTNNQVLKDQFSFNNDEFSSFLRGNGFSVNDNAYSNYPYTAMSIASSLNGRYTNQLTAGYKDKKVQSRVLYHNLIKQSSVIKALKNAGYKYYNLGSWYGATYQAPLAERDYMWEHQLSLFGHRMTLRGIEANEFLGSPFYRFAQLSQAKLWPLKITDVDQVSNVRKQLNTLNDLSTKEQPGGRFIFAHILVPHDPFFFNSDGSLAVNTATNNLGKPIKQKYIGQVQFINRQMEELINNIQKQSQGKAVIIINPDEGAYPQVMNDSFRKPSAAKEVIADGLFSEENMLSWSDDWLKMKFGIMQAVRIPKATDEDLAYLSSVNLFRIVLNRYAGYSLDYLPECHFGLTRGNQNEFDYADITGKFTASPDKSCADLQNLSDK